MVPSASVPLPFNDAVFIGSVMLRSGPALATGVWLGGSIAGFTVSWLRIDASGRRTRGSHPVNDGGG